MNSYTLYFENILIGKFTNETNASGALSGKIEYRNFESSVENEIRLKEFIEKQIYHRTHEVSYSKSRGLEHKERVLLFNKAWEPFRDLTHSAQWNVRNRENQLIPIQMPVFESKGFVCCILKSDHLKT